VAQEEGTIENKKFFSPFHVLSLIKVRDETWNLSIEVQQVKDEEANLNFNLSNLNILPFPCTEDLKGKKFLLFFIPGDGFGI